MDTFGVHPKYQRLVTIPVLNMKTHSEHWPCIWTWASFEDFISVSLVSCLSNIVLRLVILVKTQWQEV